MQKIEIKFENINVLIYNYLYVILYSVLSSFYLSK